VVPLFALLLPAGLDAAAAAPAAVVVAIAPSGSARWNYCIIADFTQHPHS
jgi:hypothetical protein